MRFLNNRPNAKSFLQGAAAAALLCGWVGVYAQLSSRSSHADDAPVDPLAALADPATPSNSGAPPETPAAPAAKNPGSNGTAGVDVSSAADKNAAAAAAEASGATAVGDGKGSNLDQYMAAKTVQQFTGRPITLQVRDVEAADVFRLISEASGFNIILSDEVKGKLTLSMTDVPWDQALDVVLHTLHLGVERNSNILRIMTLSSLTSEKQEQLKALRAAEASTPKVTKVFPISYANLTDLAATLQKFISPIAAAGAGDAVTTPAVVQVDNRTNSLVVRDLPENIERMRKLIEVLDTQTPQVMVEAKIIEATEGFSKQIGGKLGISGAGTNQFLGSFNGANAIDQLISSAGTTIATPGTNAGSSAFGISPSLSFLPGVQRINAVLNLAEGENQVKVIASPKTVVINKEKASIVQGTPVLVQGTTTVAGVGTVAANTVQSANLSLSVKPTVTNDGAVLMELAISRDIPLSVAGGEGQGVGTRNITTNVLVESGSTLVIGGIYSMTTSHASSGFPVLRKIPIIGPLFGNESDQTDRSELFIFITPRILNSKEAGLAG